MPRNHAQCACLWRTASYSSIPAATDTLRLSTAPSCGSLTRKSQVCRVRSRKPVPSAPSTSTTGPVRSAWCARSEEHTSELQSHSDLVCRLLLEKKKTGCDDLIPHNFSVEC